MIKPKTILNIDGESFLNFEKITLNQSINNHHDFSIIVDYDSIETTESYTLDTSKKWLGKTVIINFDDTDFLGTVTNVKLRHDNGFDGKLIISGYSQTILLENGTHMHSWLSATLNTIVGDTMQAAGLSAKINPTFKTPIIYQAQYQENHFQFIQRLAKQYNEWLYYDGLQLVFGKPLALAAPVTIEYGADMDTIDIAIEAIASTATNFSYNGLEDVKNESKTKGQATGLNELGSYAFEASKELYSINTKDHLSVRAENKNEIDTIVKNKQGSKVATANILSGTSTKQGLTIGTVIKVTAAKRGTDSFEVKNYGEYIITKISHTATGSSEYGNAFEAVSSGVALLPEPLVALPNASPQLATVLSNEDPNQKGRVQVQFQWQANEMKTSWLRVMSPDAGSSESNSQNRGHVFVPEVGDQVMIGFRYNDPNRPFVMGSLFNGTTAAGGLDGNKIKSIITRSGSSISFDDDEGSILIKDADNNVMHYDGKGGVVVSANKTVSLITGSSSLTMTSDGNIDISGNNITINGKETVTDISKSVTIDGADAVSINSSKKVEINSANEASMTGTAKSTISSSGTTSVEGTIIKLN